MHKIKYIHCMRIPWGVRDLKELWLNCYYWCVSYLFLAKGYAVQPMQPENAILCKSLKDKLVFDLH